MSEVENSTNSTNTYLYVDALQLQNVDYALLLERFKPTTAIMYCRGRRCTFFDKMKALGYTLKVHKHSNIVYAHMACDILDRGWSEIGNGASIVIVSTCPAVLPILDCVGSLSKTVHVSRIQNERLKDKVAFVALSEFQRMNEGDEIASQTDARPQSDDVPSDESEYADGDTSFDPSNFERTQDTNSF